MGFDFKALNISEDIVKALGNMGYEAPTQVQSFVIPSALAEKNIIVKSHTGTGKTSAFAIPAAQKVDIENRDVQAVVLAPTRELAIQVCSEINNVGRFKRLRAIAIYGGQPIETQTRALRQRVHVIVSTPGRIIDHMERGNVDLSQVKMLVIDEADLMLDMGFIEDVKKIIEKTPKDRQMMLFSATMSEKVQDLVKEYMKDAEYIDADPEKITVERINQSFYFADEKRKFADLFKILAVANPSSAILFCNMKKDVDKLFSMMRAEGYSAAAIHGDMTQEERIESVKKFKYGQCNYLIATDVAARGLDIEAVSHVINYDIPLNAESYVHRIGRTGRAGKEGTAITLVTQREKRFLNNIEEYIGESIENKQIPSAEEVREAKNRNINFVPNIKSAMKGKDKQSDVNKEITRLYIKSGKKNKLRPQDIVGAITVGAGFPGDIIGVIDIYDNFTYVDIMQGYGDRVLKALEEGTIKGKKIKVEKAKEIK